MPAANGWPWNMPSSRPCEGVAEVRLRLIVGSYARLTGRALLDSEVGASDLREALWQAPRAIVAHGTETDPVFFYGNQRALELFEMSFEQFARLPSRLSAEPLAQAAREKLLAEVSRRGYIEDYSGMRVASSGRRFMITGATVWNLLDEAGIYHGQAAVFVPASSCTGS